MDAKFIVQNLGEERLFQFCKEKEPTGLYIDRIIMEEWEDFPFHVNDPPDQGPGKRHFDLRYPDPKVMIDLPNANETVKGYLGVEDGSRDEGNAIVKFLDSCGDGMRIRLMRHAQLYKGWGWREGYTYGGFGHKQLLTLDARAFDIGDRITVKSIDWKLPKDWNVETWLLRLWYFWTLLTDGDYHTKVDGRPNEAFAVPPIFWEYFDRVWNPEKKVHTIYLRKLYDATGHGPVVLRFRQ